MKINLMGSEFYNSDDLTLKEIVGKIKAIDNRLRGLISYTEYIASNLDTSVDYTEFIGRQITANLNPRDLKRTEDNPGHRTPSFKQFRNLRREG